MSIAQNGVFNCKEWLKTQPLEAQKEIEEKAKQQIQSQMQTMQQQAAPFSQLPVDLNAQLIETSAPKD